MHRVAALLVLQEEVPQADIPEGAAHHHLVVAAPGAEGVEADRGDPLALQVAAGGLVARNRTRRRDVVGGDRVAEERQDAGAAHVLKRGRLAAHALEEGGIANVGGVRIPVVETSLFGQRQGFPVFVAVEDVGIALAVHRRLERRGDRVPDLFRRGPEVGEEDRPAVGALAQRLVVEVDVDASGEREGHDEHRRGQVVRPHEGVDAGLVVPVSGEDRGDDQAMHVDRVRHRSRKGSAVADAGRAPVADQVEAQLLEVPHQARGFQIVGDDLRAGGQAGLHPGLDLHTQGAGLPGHEPGADHHRRVGGVGAAGDRRHHDRPVPNLHPLPVHLDLDGSALGGRDRGPAAHSAPVCSAPAWQTVPGGNQPGQIPVERGTQVRQRDPVLRTLGPGDARLDSGEVQLHRRRVLGVGCVVGAEESLFAGDPLDSRDQIRASAGAGQIPQRLVVHREETDRGAVFGRHVGQGGLVRQAQAGESGAVVLDEPSHDAMGAQHLRHAQHEVRGRRALGQGPGQSYAHYLGEEHIVGLAEEHRFRFDPAHAPTHHAEAVDHGGVGVGADQRIGIGEVRPAILAAMNDRGQVFQVDLVHDPRTGWHHTVVLERLLGPAEKGVALAVALVFTRDVLLEGLSRPEKVDLYGVVDDEVRGDQGIDPRRVAAHLPDTVPHGRQVHDRGYSGEVLKDHPSGHEGEVSACVGGAPGRHRLDVFRRDVAVPCVAQGVLEEDANGEGEAVQSGDAHLLQAAQTVE